jgi:hypothetical protein
MSAPNKRFRVHDTLAATASSLITPAARARRYWVLDAEAQAEGTDFVYDEFASKRAATDTARDLNRGLYGPLAETKS